MSLDPRFHPQPQIILSSAFSHPLPPPPQFLHPSGFSPIPDPLLGLHPTASIQQPRPGPEPTRHFLEPSSLGCISTFPDYSSLMPSCIPASRRGLLARDSAKGSCPMGPTPPPVGCASPSCGPLPVNYGLCPLLSAPTPHSTRPLHSQSCYLKLAS